MSLASRTVACIAALAAAVAAGSAGANPTGLEVVRGSASLGNPATGILEIHNSSGAILEWGGFSIGAGETTRFLQPSELSAVLNRVVGADPSALLGRLESNGRVFLINPHGIVFGPGAVVDTAGLVASSLGMSDADFIAGRLRFEGDASAGDVINHGVIKSAAGGHVILVAPKIANEGLIQADDGRLLLAAGTALGITSLDSPGVEYLVRAPDNEVLNVGRLLADGGAIDVFAGSLRHSGEIRADTVSRDALGRIRLDASADITLETGSRVSASGAPGGEHGGGEVRVVAGGALDLEAGAEVRVDGGVDGGDGGFLELSGHRDVRLVGSYSGRARKAGFANGSLLLDPTDIEIVAASVSTVGVSGLGFNDYLAASSPDGTRVYVSMRGGQNRVAVFDVGTNTVVTEIPLGGSNPGAIAVSPDGSTLYVLNESTDDISVIDTGTLAETATIAVGDEPRFVLFSADGTRAYVSTRGLSDSLYVIDTATDSVTDTVVLGNDPGHMAFSTDGATLYVANQAGNSLSVVDVTEPGPPGIIGGVLATVTEVGGGLDGAFTVVAHPDATRVYVSTAFPNNKVGVIDTATNTVASVITVGSAPYFMDLARDGRADPKLYVANLFGDSVSVIDTDTDTVATTITGLGGFVRVAVSADGLRAYVASEGASEVHVIDTFDDTVLRTFDGTDGVASAIVPVVTATGSRLVVPQFGDDNLFVIGAATDATGGDGTVGVGDPNSPSPPAPPDTLQIDPSSLAGAWSSVSLTAIQDIRVLDPIRGSDLGAGVDLTLFALRDLIVDASIGSLDSPVEELSMLAGNEIRINRSIHAVTSIGADASSGGRVLIDGVTLQVDNPVGGMLLGGNVVITNATLQSAGLIGLVGQGTGAGTATERAGITIDNSRLDALTMFINGTGFAAGDAPGIAIVNGTVVSTTGNAVLDGIGGSTGAAVSDNPGIRISGAGTRLESTFAGPAPGTLLDLTGVGGSTAGGGNHGIELSAGAEIVADTGDISLDGSGGAGTAQNAGVLVTGAGTRVHTTGSGDITLLGVGAGSTTDNVGVRIDGDSRVETIGAGDIALDGTGSLAGTDDNDGVRIDGASTIVRTSGGGDIGIDGLRGGTGDGNDGIVVSGGALLATTGAGTMTLGALRGPGTPGSNNAGIRLAGAGSTIIAENGDLFMTGAGDGSGTFNEGINLGDGVLESTGSARLDLTGSGGAGTDGNAGIRLRGGVQVRSNGGFVAMQGTSGGTGNDNTGIAIEDGSDVTLTGGSTLVMAAIGAGNAPGLRVAPGATVIGGPSATGSLIISASTTSGTDAIDLGTASVQSSGLLRLRSTGVADAYGIGGAPGVFNLSGTDLATLADGFSRIEIGFSSATGRITVGGATFSDPLTLSNTGVGSAGIEIAGNLATGGNDLDMFSRGTIEIGADIDAGGGAIDTLITGISGDVEFISSPTVTASTFRANTITAVSSSVTLDTFTSTTDLSLTGGSLTGSGDMSIGGTFTWSGARLGGSGTTTVEGIGLVSMEGLAKEIDGRTLLVNSASGSTWSAGNLGFRNGGRLEVRGTLEVTGDALVANNLSAGGAIEVLTNGTFSKTTSTLTTRVQNGVTFDVASGGVLEVSAGTLSLQGGSTLGGSAGTLRALGTGAIDIDGPTYRLADGARLEGDGLLLFGEVEVLAGATVTSDADVTVEVGEFDFIVNGSAALQNLDVSGGTVRGTGATTVAGTLSWSDGRFTEAGTTTVQSGGRLAMSGGAKEIQVHTLRSESATGSTWTGGALNFRDGARFEVAGDLELTTDVSLSNLSGGGSMLIDTGAVFSKTGGAATATVGGGITFDNDGTVAVSSGALRLEGGSTAAGSSGTFRADGAGQVAFAGGTHVMADGARFEGSGTLQVAAGITRVPVAANLTSDANSTVEVAGGVFEVEGTAALNDLTLSSGVHSGAGDATVGGTLAWSGGLLTGAGSTTVAPGGRLTMSGGAKELQARTLRSESASGSTWTGGALNFRDLGRFEVAGALEQTADAPMANLSGGGSVLIDAGGSFTKTGGVVSLVNNGVTMEVDGTLSVNSGRLDMQGGSGGVGTGTFRTAGSGDIWFSAGTWQFGDGSLISGPGDFVLGGSIILLTGTGTGTTLDSDATLLLNPHAIGGAGVLRNDGTIIAEGLGNSIGNLDNRGGGELIVRGTAGGDARLLVDTLSNAGTITLTNTSAGTNVTLATGSAGLVNNGRIDATAGAGGGERKIEGGPLANASNGIIEASGALLVVDSGANPLGTAPSNAGIVRASGADIEFNDHTTLTHSGGAIEIGAGRTLTVADGDLVWQGGALQADPSGTLAFAGGAGLVLGGSGARSLDGIDMTFDDLTLVAGSLSVSNARLTDTGSPTLNAGTTLQLANAGAVLDNTGPLTVNGTLSGSGTVTGDVQNTGGTLAAGSSPGQLVILGNYTHGSTATLLVEMQGPLAGTGYDWLDVQGTVTLAGGTLRAATLAGYSPVGGTTFDFITAASGLTGDFVVFDLPAGWSRGIGADFYRLTAPFLAPPPSSSAPSAFVPPADIASLVDPFSAVVTLYGQDYSDDWSATVLGVTSDDQEEARRGRLSCQ